MSKTDDLRVIRSDPPPFKCCASCYRFCPEYEDFSESGWCDHPDRGESADHSGFRHAYRSKGVLVVIVEKNSSCNRWEPRDMTQ